MQELDTSIKKALLVAFFFIFTASILMPKISVILGPIVGSTTMINVLLIQVVIVVGMILVRSKNSGPNVIAKIFLLGINMVTVSYALASVIYVTPNPTPDQIGLFVNALLGSAVSMVAIGEMQKE